MAVMDMLQVDVSLTHRMLQLRDTADALVLSPKIADLSEPAPTTGLQYSHTSELRRTTLILRVSGGWLIIHWWARPLVCLWFSLNLCTANTTPSRILSLFRITPRLLDKIESKFRSEVWRVMMAG